MRQNCGTTCQCLSCGVRACCIPWGRGIASFPCQPFARPALLINCVLGLRIYPLSVFLLHFISHADGLRMWFIEISKAIHTCCDHSSFSNFGWWYFGPRISKITWICIARISVAAHHSDIKWPAVWDMESLHHLPEQMDRLAGLRHQNECQGFRPLNQ